jgi:hypothetical protein
MRKTLSWAIILLLSLSSLGLAQRTTYQGRSLRLPPAVTLSVARTAFTAGEQVDFALRVTQGPLTLQGCYFTLERQTGLNNWTEFYRSAQNPFGQAFLAPNMDQSFSWDQSNSAGTMAAAPGAWRLRFYVPGAVGEPGTVYFNIQPRVAVSGGPLELKLMRYKLPLGMEAVFRLENMGNQVANLRGDYYIIQYRSGNRWFDFFKSRVDPLAVQSLAPGQVYKWGWSQRDRAGRFGPRGDWRIVFYAPLVPNSPVETTFDIR